MALYRTISNDINIRKKEPVETQPYAPSPSASSNYTGTNFNTNDIEKTIQQRIVEARKQGVEIPEQLLPQENKDTYLSGGRLMDIGDILSTLQYGIAGFAKGALNYARGEGKGSKNLLGGIIPGIKNIIPGIKERASWTDKELLGGQGTAGKIAGFGADLLADPANLVGGVLFKTGAKGAKVIKGSELFGKIAKVEKVQTVADFLGKKLIPRFKQPLDFVKLDEKRLLNIKIGTQDAIDLGKRVVNTAEEVAKEQFSKVGGSIKDLTKNNNQLIAKILKGEVTDLSQIDNRLITVAGEVRDTFKKVGNELVDLGLLDAETYYKNINDYFPQMYRIHEFPEEVQKAFKGSSSFGADLKPLAQRKDIPEEIRTAMGEILEAGYPTAKKLTQLTDIIENVKFNNKVAELFSVDEAVDGFKKLGSGGKWATSKLNEKLAGKYVPDVIYDAMTELNRVKGTTEKAFNKATAYFKFGKVVLNPATHARNVVSNFILNNSAGLPWWKVDSYVKAGKTMAGKTKFAEEIKKFGGWGTYAQQEISNLIGLEGSGKLAKTKNVVKGAIDKVSNIYQKEEEFAKTAMYVFQRESGKSVEAAQKLANAATFDYSAVTPFIRKLRESAFGVPFITFTYKATPAFVKTAIKNPKSITGIFKGKTFVESLTGKKEVEELKKYANEDIADNLQVALPIKDKYDRTFMLDLSYFIPSGDILTGKIAPNNPAFSIVRDLYTNRDYFGNKIYDDGKYQDKKGDTNQRELTEDEKISAFKSIGAYVYKQLAPPLAGQSAVSLYKGITKKEDYLGRKANTTQSLLSKFLGIRTTQIDPNEQEYFTKREDLAGLEDWLKNQGMLNSINYVPKNKQ